MKFRVNYYEGRCRILAAGRFQFTDAPHLDRIFRHFTYQTFSIFISVIIIYNISITSLVTGTFPLYCC